MIRHVRPRDWLLATVLLGSTFLFSTIVISTDACSLCMSQRFFMAFGVFFCIVCLANRKIQTTYIVLAMLMWLCGCGVAVRQLWIQYVPGAAQNCGPGIDYLISRDYPLSDIVKAMLTGSADCAEPSVVPILALVGFAILLSTSTIYFFARRASFN